MTPEVSRGRLWAIGAAIAAVHLVLFALLPLLPITSDSVGYDEIALSVARGEPWLLNGESQVAWMPGYPSFVGLVYLVFGHRPAVVFAIQALLVGVDAVLMFVLARRLLGARPALVAMAWVGLTPVLVAYQGILASESLALPLVLGLLEAMTRPVPATLRGQARWAMWVGFLGGALCFTRADYVLWMLGVPALLWRAVPWKRVVGLTAVAATVTLLWLAPWVVRNARAHGEIIPFTAISGRTFWMGAQQPEETEYGSSGYVAAERRCEAENPRRPAARDACMNRDGWRIAATHPVYFGEHVFVRIARTLFSSNTDYLPGFQVSFGQARAQGLYGVLALKALLLLAHVLLAVLALVGFVRRRREFFWLMLGLMLASKLAIHGIVFGTGRYAVPFLPVLLLGALAAFWPPRPLAPLAEPS